MMLQGWNVAGKAWTALFGSLFAGSVLPWFLDEVAPSLPAPWPALIGAVVALATAVGAYHAPYQPVTKDGPVETPWPKS